MKSFVNGENYLDEAGDQLCFVQSCMTTNENLNTLSIPVLNQENFRKSVICHKLEKLNEKETAQFANFLKIGTLSKTRLLNQNPL